MIDGIPLVDVHLHPARRPTLKVDWQRWALEFGRGIPFDDLYDQAGALRPDRFDAYLESEGVDVALLMSEYSPRVTGIQPVEDLLPCWSRTRGGSASSPTSTPTCTTPSSRSWTASSPWARPRSSSTPSTASHPTRASSTWSTGAAPSWGPRSCSIPVPAPSPAPSTASATHPHRRAPQASPTSPWSWPTAAAAWWYDAAAFLALPAPTSGSTSPASHPARPPAYYARFDLNRLAKKCIFGSDWPSAPGIATNARALTKLDLDDDPP